MEHRVGVLLVGPDDALPIDLDRLASFCRELDEWTSEARGGLGIEFLAYANTHQSTAVDAALAPFGSVTAVYWTNDGIVLADGPSHQAGSSSVDDGPVARTRAFEAIVSLSHVVVVACASQHDFQRISQIVDSFRNSWTLVVVLSLGDDARLFQEINPLPRNVASPDWFLMVKKRWQTPAPSVEHLPTSKVAVLGQLFPWLTSAVIRQRFETVRRRPRAMHERCSDGLGVSQNALEMMERGDQKLMTGHLEQLCPLFLRHDELGRFYANVFRTSCLLVPLMIAISTILAVAATLDRLHAEAWHVVEAVLLISAIALVIRTRTQAHHRKWVTHRLTAELMRCSFLCGLFQKGPHVDLPTEDPNLWVEQTRGVLNYLRTLSPLCFVSVGGRLLAARRAAIVGFAQSQETFHRRFAEQHHRAHKWLVRLSGRAFLITLCLVGIQLGLATLFTPPERVTTAMMMATLICAGAAFTVLLIVHQLGFEAIAERSANAADRYSAIRVLVNDNASTASAYQVYSWADECLSAYVNEQHSWYRHIPLVRLDI